jgi:hypothetical protein
MKNAAKIRQETYPLLLLANAKGYSSGSTFKLTPSGFPKIDAVVSTEEDTYSLQITIADPIRSLPDGSPSNGGYDERLVREALNKHAVDFPFDRIVEHAVDVVGREKVNRAFGAYCFVDEGSYVDEDVRIFLEIIP